MLQPEHLRPFQAAHSTPRRLISATVVVGFHLLVIIAFASGLAQQLAKKLPEELKAEVVKEKIPDVKPPPPPPPDLAKPPPPFVPPPDITIANDAPVTNTITVQNKVATPPKEGITAPASIGAAHNCGQRYYPPIAQRLNQEGTTKLSFKIGPDGSVSDVTVAESSGHDSLDEAAVRCVSASWHYKPAMQNGQPITVPWQANVKWQLTN